MKLAYFVTTLIGLCTTVFLLLNGSVLTAIIVLAISFITGILAFEA